jgi:hypothetical protein
MALPGPGSPISFSQINTELGFGATTTCSLQTRTGQTAPAINQAAPYSVSEFQSHVQETVEITPTSQTVAGTNGTTAVYTITTSESWTASDDQAWATPDKNSGTGNDTITYTLTENNTGSTRFTIITITTSGGATDTASIAQQSI